MNHWILETNGCWEDTILTNNGEEVPATEFYLNLECGRGFDGEPIPGGVSMDGYLTGLVRLQDEAFPDIPIFPGVIELITPRGNLRIENFSPIEIYLPATRIFLDGESIENNVIDMTINLNYNEDTMCAVLGLYRDRLLFDDELLYIELI